MQSKISIGHGATESNSPYLQQKRRAARPVSDKASWDVQDLADELLVHPLDVLRLVAKGRIKASRVGDSMRFAKTDIEKFLGQDQTDLKIPAGLTFAMDAAAGGDLKRAFLTAADAVTGDADIQSAIRRQLGGRVSDPMQVSIEFGVMPPGMAQAIDVQVNGSSLRQRWIRSGINSALARACRDRFSMASGEARLERFYNDYRATLDAAVDAFAASTVSYTKRRTLNVENSRTTRPDGSIEVITRPIAVDVRYTMPTSAIASRSQILGEAGAIS